MSIGYLLIYTGAIFASLSSNMDFRIKYLIHSILQSLGIILLFIGVLTIVFGKGFSEPHFTANYYHAYIGVVTAIFTIFLQPLLSYRLVRRILNARDQNGEITDFNFRNNAEYKVPKTIHKIIGWISVVLSLVTIGLGMMNISERIFNFWSGILIGTTFIIVLLLLTVSFSRSLNPTKKYNYKKNKDDKVNDQLIGEM